MVPSLLVLLLVIALALDIYAILKERTISSIALLLVIIALLAGKI